MGSSSALEQFLRVGCGGFPSGSVVKNPPAVQERQETRVQSLGGEDSLEEGMASHSSILTWRIPWTEEPGGTVVHRVTKSQTRLKQACNP